MLLYYRFNPAELAFLTEYAAAMSPVAQATNILQAEANAQMGWLLPTINLLTIKLDQAKLQLKYRRPLVDALQVGIKKKSFWPHDWRPRVNRSHDSSSKI